MTEMRPTTILILMVLMAALVAPLMFMSKFEPPRGHRTDDAKPILPTAPVGVPPLTEPEDAPDQEAERADEAEEPEAEPED
jgi:hypothetical protein